MCPIFYNFHWDTHIQNLMWAELLCIYSLFNAFPHLIKCFLLLLKEIPYQIDFIILCHRLPHHFVAQGIKEDMVLSFYYLYFIISFTDCEFAAFTTGFTPSVDGNQKLWLRLSISM